MRTRNCETAYSVSNIIAKHRHGLATDCHHLPMVPMFPIVPQSALMVSVADVSVRLYSQYEENLGSECWTPNIRKTRSPNYDSLIHLCLMTKLALILTLRPLT